MVIAILLGIAGSIAQSIIVWLDHILRNTVLKGNGAFILSFGISLILSAISIGMNTQIDMTWASMTDYASKVFAASQLFFMLVTRNLGLVIKDPREQEVEG